MLVLTTGMIRSGSTWSFNVCANLLRAANVGDVHCGVIEAGGDWRQFASDNNRHAVLKCHALDAKRIGWLQRNGTAAKFIYTFRDPRDVAASALATFNTPLDEALSLAERSLQFLDVQRRIGPVCIVPYGAINNGSSDAAIRTLAEYLEVDLPASVISSVDRLCRRETQRALLDNFAGMPESEVHRDQWHVYHRPTLLHHNHFRGQDAPGWESLLDGQQVKRAAMIVEAHGPLYGLKTATVLH